MNEIVVEIILHLLAPFYTPPQNFLKDTWGRTLLFEKTGVSKRQGLVETHCFSVTLKRRRGKKKKILFSNFIAINDIVSCGFNRQHPEGRVSELHLLYKAMYIA